MFMRKLLSLLALLCITMLVQAQSWTAPATNTFGSGQDPASETVVYASLTTNVGVAANFTIGAFVDGTCRASATAQSYQGNTFFTLRVFGSAADQNKSITFKAYDGTSGLEYDLTTTVMYDGESHAQPSQPLVLTLNGAAEIDIEDIEVGVGETVNIMDYVTVSPQGAALPTNYKFEIDADDAALATISGSQLTGVTTGSGVFAMMLDNSNNGQGGNVINARILAECLFTVVQHATAINIVNNSLEVKITANGPDMAYFNQNFPNCYEVLPETSTDEVKFEIGNTEIVQYTPNGWHISGPGTTTITPYIEKADGTRLTPANNATITLTVKQMVTAIELAQSEMTVNVGDDEALLRRINSWVTVQPQNASTPAVTWTSSAPAVVEVVNSGQSFIVKAAGQAVLTVAATDGSGVSEQLLVVVEDPTTTATFAENPLVISTESQLSVDAPLDITQQIIANITFDGGADSYRYGSITVSGDAVAGNASISRNDGITGEFFAVGAGTSTVTVTLQYPDYGSETLDTPNNQTTVPMATATYTFDVQVLVQVAVTGMKVSFAQAGDGKGGTLTLEPIPADATIDQSNVAVSVTNNRVANYPAWTPTFQYVQTSNGTLQYSMTAAMPDDYTLTVMVNGQAVPLYDVDGQTPLTAVSVPDAIEFDQGWQWRSNPFGQLFPDSLENIFQGNNLYEVRTQRDLLINDPAWGYFGSIMSNGTPIAQATCFKVKMTTKPGKPSVIYGTLFNNGDISIAPGWTWIGNPFFYDRQISHAFATAGASIPSGTFIVSKTNGSAEWNGTAWEGDLEVLPHHQGFLMFNPGTTAFTLRYATEYAAFAPLDEKGTNSGNGGNGAPRRINKLWQYDASQFMNNMTMVAQLPEGVDDENYSIGAFVDDECRGEGKLINGKAFITVHTDGGEMVSLKLYNKTTGELISINETFRTQGQGRLGSLKAPLKLHADISTATKIEQLNGGDTNNVIYNLNGQRLSKTQRGVNIVNGQKVLVK